MYRSGFLCLAFELRSCKWDRSCVICHAVQSNRKKRIVKENKNVTRQGEILQFPDKDLIIT